MGKYTHSQSAVQCFFALCVVVLGRYTNLHTNTHKYTRNHTSHSTIIILLFELHAVQSCQLRERVSPTNVCINKKNCMSLYCHHQ